MDTELEDLFLQLQQVQEEPATVRINLSEATRMKLQESSLILLWIIIIRVGSMINPEPVRWHTDV